MDNLEVERQRLLNMRRSHVEDYRHDEKVIDTGTTHLDRVSTAVSQIAESWLQSAQGRGDSAPLPVERPASAGATTGQDPDEEAPPSSCMVSIATLPTAKPRKKWRMRPRFWRNV